MSEIVRAFADFSESLPISPLAWWIAKITAVLCVAWVMHLALTRANPRLRVLLWRAAAVVVVAVSVLTWLPPLFTVHVKPSNTKLDNVDNDVPPQHALAIAPIQKKQPPLAINPRSPTSEKSANRSVAVKNSTATPSTRTLPSAAPVADRPVWGDKGIQQGRLPNTVRRVAALDSRAQIRAVCAAAILAWLMFAAAYALRFLVGYIRLRTTIRISTGPPDWINQERDRLLKRLQFRSSIHVLQSNKVTTPCLVGVSSPIVLLPSRMCIEARRDDVVAALAHELSHAATNDHLWNHLLHGLSIGLWFHPLAAMLRAAHLRACEDACDAAAADLMGGRAVYSRSLARIALDVATPLRANSLAMARSADVTRRLRLLGRTNIRNVTIGRPTRFTAGVLTVFVLVIVGGFAVSSEETAETTAASSNVPSTIVRTDATITPQILQESRRRTIRELGDRRFHPANQIRTLAFSPNGKLLATLDLNQPRAIHLWDVSTGDEVRVLAVLDQGWKGTQAFAFTPDGTKIIAGDYTGQLGIFDVETGRQQARLKAHAKAIQAIAVSADGKLLATGGQDGRIRACLLDKPENELWSLGAGKGQPEGGTMIIVGAYGVNALAFTPDGKQLVTAAANEANVAVLDAMTGKVAREIKNVHGGGTGKEMSGPLQSLAVTPDGKSVVTGGNRTMRRADVPNEVINHSVSVRLAEAKVWDLATGQLTRDLMKDRLELGSGYVALSGDGKTVAVRHDDKLQLIGLDDGSIKHSIPLSGWSMRPPAFSPDGKLLATARDNSVYLLDVATGKRLFADKPRHESDIQAIAYSRGAQFGDERVRRDGSLGKLYRYTKPVVATGGSNGQVHFWDAETGEHLLEESFGSHSSAWDLTFSDDGTCLAVSGYSDDAAGAQMGTVAVWWLDRGSYRIPLPFRGEGIALSPDGNRFVVAHSNGGMGFTRLELWDLGKHRRIAEFPRNSENGLSQYKTMRFSPDGRYVQIAEYDGTVTRWDTSADAQDVKFVADWRKHVDIEGRVPKTPWLGDAEFTPDGKTLVTSTDENMLIWDVGTGEATGKIVVPSAKHGFHIAIAPDNRTLVTSEVNYANAPGVDTIRLFDLQTRELVLTLEPDGDRPSTFAFSPDSTQLITGFDRGTATVWDIKR